MVARVLMEALQSNGLVAFKLRVLLNPRRLVASKFGDLYGLINIMFRGWGFAYFVQKKFAIHELVSCIRGIKADQF